MVLLQEGAADSTKTILRDSQQVVKATVCAQFGEVRGADLRIKKRMWHSSHLPSVGSGASLKSEILLHTKHPIF